MAAARGKAVALGIIRNMPLMVTWMVRI